MYCIIQNSALWNTWKKLFDFCFENERMNRWKVTWNPSYRIIKRLIKQQPQCKYLHYPIVPVHCPVMCVYTTVRIIQSFSTNHQIENCLMTKTSYCFPHSGLSYWIWHDFISNPMAQHSTHSLHTISNR